MIAEAQNGHEELNNFICTGPYQCSDQPTLALQEGDTGGHEHRAPLQQTGPHRTGQVTQCDNIFVIISQQTSRPVSDSAHPLGDDVLDDLPGHGGPSPLEDRLQAGAPARGAGQVLQPVHPEERALRLTAAWSQSWWEVLCWPWWT